MWLKWGGMSSEQLDGVSVIEVRAASVFPQPSLRRFTGPSASISHDRCHSGGPETMASEQLWMAKAVAYLLGLFGQASPATIHVTQPHPSPLFVGLI